ncbi:MAG: glycosyltransferase family 4 protein, partial [Acidimicrobiales bacterium]
MADAEDAAFVPLMLGGDWHHDRPGGLNRYVADLAAALRRDGIRTRATVVGPAANAPVGTVAASSARQFLPVRLWSYARAAGRLAGEVDLVDAHFALYAGAPTVAGRLRRLPLVVHFQGPWADEDFAAGTLRRARVRAKRLTELAVYRRAAAFVTLSAAFKRILVERYGVAPWDVHVIPPGVDLGTFRPGDPESARRRVGVDGRGPVVVTVRRLVPRMGLDVLLDAWATIDPGLGARLLIVGEGPERSPLHAKAEAMGLSSSVRFLGRVDEDLLVACYQAADVSVVPSV